MCLVVNILDLGFWGWDFVFGQDNASEVLDSAGFDSFELKFSRFAECIEFSANFSTLQLRRCFLEHNIKTNAEEFHVAVRCSEISFKIYIFSGFKAGSDSK